MELPRTASKPFEVTVTAALPDGTPATVTGASFALCEHGGPTDATVWTPATTWAAPKATGRIKGPDSTDATAGLVATTARPELWGLPTSPQAVDPFFVETIEVL